jgi:cold shock CspA family protein
LIPEEENARDVFVHISDLEKSGLKMLVENMEVQYEERQFMGEEGIVLRSEDQ